MDKENRHYAECYRVDSNCDFSLMSEQIEVTSTEDINWNEIPEDAVALRFYDQESPAFIFIGKEYKLADAQKEFPTLPFLEYAKEMKWDRLVRSEGGSWQNVGESDKVVQRP